MSHLFIYLFILFCSNFVSKKMLFSVSLSEFTLFSNIVSYQSHMKHTLLTFVQSHFVSIHGICKYCIVSKSHDPYIAHGPLTVVR